MAAKTYSDDSYYDHFLWDTPQTGIATERLHAIASVACQQYSATRQADCRVDFYPYSALKNTIRMENGLIRIRISDILCEAPEEILLALIHILLARLVRRKPLGDWVERFGEYIRRPEIEEIHARTRRARNRKVLTHPQGEYHDLDASFERVNRQYFEGKLSRPTLTWSPKRSRRQLGYHDATLNLISMSRYLDRRKVPEFVVDYIMYHELLHTVIRPTIRKGKRVVHSPEFRRTERQFARYEEAIRWLQSARS